MDNHSRDEIGEAVAAPGNANGAIAMTNNAIVAGGARATAKSRAGGGSNPVAGRRTAVDRRTTTD